ncbi:MAG: hypothetical protein QOD99_398 [Chthoniobacter sp.]|jgi:DNA-directed RNA polymerase specialized sigma24 family protein|nr:hypothetical protein [Chthoniobacter sp.]
MMARLDFAALIDEKIEPLYRFALLLTGDTAAAERALIAVAAQCESQMEEFRNSRSRLVFYVGKLRDYCAKTRAPASAAQPAIVAQLQSLPEPGRSALALFYLDVFPAQEIAAILKTSLEELSQILDEGRDRLRRNAPASAA